MEVKQISETIETIVDNYYDSSSVHFTGIPSKEVRERFNSETHTLVDVLTADDVQLLPKTRSRKIGEVLKGVGCMAVITGLGYYYLGTQEHIKPVEADFFLLMATFSAVKLLTAQIPKIQDYFSLTYQIEEKYKKRNS